MSSAATLAQLIEERLRPGADAAAIDRRIWSMFGETWCVVFTDMSGFSRRAAREGIVPFLALIHQLGKICHPVIAKHGGLLLKTIADSYMILFRNPKDAMAACIEMQQAIQRYNSLALAPDHIYLCCGLGHGEILKLGDQDAFGVEVNFAAKLGEDLADPYEILLTPAAVKAVGRMKGVSFRKVPGGRLGGTKLPYYSASYPLPEPDGAKQARKARLRFR